MSEIQELGQTTDEIIANLEYIDNLLTQGCKRLQSFGTDIDSRQEALNQNFLLNEHLEQFAQSLQESEEGFEAVAETVMEAFSEFQQILVSTHFNLEQVSQGIEEAEDSFKAELADVLSDYEGSFGDIEVSLADMQETTQQIEDSLEDEINDTRTVLEAFDQALADLHGKAEEFTEVYAIFDSLSNELSFHQSTAESEFEELNQKLEQEDLNEIQGRIETAQETFTQFLNDFEEDINRNAEEKLRDEITKLISDFEAVCEHEIKPQLESEFQKHVNDRLNGTEEYNGLLENLERSNSIALRANEIARDAGINCVHIIQNAKNMAKEIDECLEAQMS